MAAKKYNLPAAQQPDVSREEMGLFTEQALELSHWRPVCLKDATQIQERVDEYFSWCIQNERRPFIEGLALALGTSRQQLCNMQREQSKRGEIIRKAKQAILFLLEQWNLDGKINPVSAIFLLKNIGGYQDRLAIEASSNGRLKAEMTPQEIAMQIAEDIPVDNDLP